MGSNQTFKRLHSKGNHKQNEKTQWEKIFANDATNKELMYKIQKQLMLVQIARVYIYKQFNMKKQPRGLPHWTSG